MLFEDFVDILELLSDPEKYKAKVKELTDRETSIKANIALGVTAANVVEIQRKADTQLKRATEALDQATKQADTLVAGATVAFNKRNADLQEREIVAETAIASNKQATADRLASEQAIRTLEKQLNTKALTLQAQAETLRLAQADVDERLTKLRTVMS